MWMGNVLKIIVLYASPFWRAAGFSGECISEVGPIAVCYDDCSHDNKAFAIVGYPLERVRVGLTYCRFVTGQAAIAWGEKPAAERQAAVLECYRRWWGEDALRPTAYLETAWKQEEHSRGCYFGLLAPGAYAATKGAHVCRLER
jgi:monoamine oxidase